MDRRYDFTRNTSAYFCISLLSPPSVRSEAFGTGCFLCNAFPKNRTDRGNENICIFSKNGPFNSQSFMAIGDKVVRQIDSFRGEKPIEFVRCK